MNIFSLGWRKNQFNSLRRNEGGNKLSLFLKKEKEFNWVRPGGERAKIGSFLPREKNKIFCIVKKNEQAKVLKKFELNHLIKLHLTRFSHSFLT